MDADREQVRAWVEAMDAQGYTSDEIREQLALAGWSKEDITALLGEPVAPAPPAATPPPVEVPPSPVVPPPLAAPPVAEPPVLASPLPQPATPVAAAPVVVPPAPGYVTAPAPTPGAVPPPPNGMATAALVLGISSFFFGPLLAIVGIILGIIGMKRGGPQRGLAVGGLVLSIIVLCGWLLFGAIFLIAYRVGSSTSEDSSTESVLEDARSPEADPVNPDASSSLLPRSGDDRETCLIRLKALAAGMQMYAVDYESSLPDAADWPVGLGEYVQEADFLCPADPRSAPQSVGGQATSFTMYEPAGGLITSSLSEPEKAYLLFDGTEIAGEESAAAFRHDGGLHLAYVDGHAQWVNQDRFLHPD